MSNRHILYVSTCEKILSHACSSVGAAFWSSSLFFSLLAGVEWSERKDSGSLVGEWRGRKGNQATWANTRGSAQTLRTQMCLQLRLPGSRRWLCFSLVLFLFLFVYLFFTLPLSALPFILFIFYSPPFHVGHSVSLSPIWAITVK